MIYISTGAFSKKKPTQTYKYLLKKNFSHIEFSCGKYDMELKKIIKKNSRNIQFHNYFPPKKNPFVFNLSSTNKAILNKSIVMAKENIRNSKKVGAKYFSFHAGFRTDPLLSELGNKIEQKKIIQKKVAKKIFYQSLKKLIIYAKKYGVILLIENNVVSKKNLKVFGENPFLLADPKEINDLFLDFQNENKNIGLLLDVGHLKISAKTLNFNLFKAHKKITKFVKGYHLSDNDGYSDSNKPFTKNSWFWKNMSNNAKFYTIEVYNVPHQKYYKLINLTKKKIASNLK